MGKLPVTELTTRSLRSEVLLFPEPVCNDFAVETDTSAYAKAWNLASLGSLKYGDLRDVQEHCELVSG